MAKKIIRKKKSAEPLFNKTEMENSQLELYRVKKQLKQLGEREKELKGRLDTYMTHALNPDTKGHYLFTTVNEDGEKIHLQKQARKKISLNEERAKAYLIENGYDDVIISTPIVAEDVTQDQVIEVLLKHAPHLLVEKEIVDEVAIEQLLGNETIPMEDFEQLCDINITYAMTYIDDKKLQEAEGEENAVKGHRKNL